MTLHRRRYVSHQGLHLSADIGGDPIDPPVILLVRGQESDLLTQEDARQLLALIPPAEFVDVERRRACRRRQNAAFNGAIARFLNHYLQIT
ncbi:hypothetical protein [Stutzerimonas stutzeri]|uniref:hypothetical protein n=1 Tax=Stutzerimonas stutzeri TaxID=316 RepID=UPI0024497B25|nr:hypothetical protein [Stutzerimonas stutzeri]MDH0426663.1 hypothetical protein [Stutzerimonas stutzeri]